MSAAHERSSEPDGALVAREPASSVPPAIATNVVLFTRSRGETAAHPAPPVAFGPGERPAPYWPGRERPGLIVVLLFLSLLVHGGLYALFNRPPEPMATIGLEAITVEIVLGADTPAGLAATAGESEMQRGPLSDSDSKPTDTEAPRAEHANPAETAQSAPPETSETRPEQELPPSEPEQELAALPVEQAPSEAAVAPQEPPAPPEPAALAKPTTVAPPPQPEPKPVQHREQRPKPEPKPVQHREQRPKPEPKPVQHREQRPKPEPKPVQHREQTPKPERDVKPRPERDVRARTASREPDATGPRANAPTGPRANAPTGPRANAPGGVGLGRSQNDANYPGLVFAHLARYKRFPPEAHSRGDRGSATVGFTLDGGGRVTRVSLVRSSGFSSLDQEATAMVRRASPFPAPPGGRPTAFTAPVSFRIQ
jgi:periplasmic protein TonB